MNLRFIDWIWHVRGSVALAPAQSSDEAFDRLDPLFRQPGTSHDRTDGTLVFTKKDQAAQDKMSIFDAGVLQVEPRAAGPVLRYDMTSRIMLFCFIAPFLFLAVAQLTVFVGNLEKASSDAAPKKPEKKDKVVTLNPIDKFLGAPAPDPPKKKGKDKDKDKDKDDKKRSPTPAYVFAAIFATLYVVGRLLEVRLVKTLFRNRLRGA
ncbi:hypothetical protein [Sphingomonas sp. PB4P5]|uniref:hypothetical protein n=1 Tax=Parasphingomonas puruogangriensis TaxID=3096155 RepID=UPI002FCB6BBB